MAPGKLPGSRALAPVGSFTTRDHIGRGSIPPRSCDHGRIRPSEHHEEPPELEPLADEPPARRFDAWRRRSAIGAIATGVALGLKEIFQPTNIEPVITAEAPGDPPDDENRLRVVLDPQDPSKSVAYLPRETGEGAGSHPEALD